MRAAPYDAPLVEHDDLVGMEHRGNALGHDDLRFAAKLLGERMAQRGVGFVVERAEAVVEQERARIGGKRAGNGQALALAARDVRAALGDFGFKALVHVVHEVGLSDFRGGAHAFGVRLVGGVVDVFLNRAAEQEGLLRNVAQLAAQRAQRQVANIDAVDGNGAFRYIGETLHELDHRRLARTGRADDGRGLTGLRGEVDVLEHAILRAGILEAHIVEGDFGAARARGELVVAARFRRRVGNRAFRLQHLVDALGGHIGAWQHDGKHANHEEAHDDDHGIGDERDKVARLQRARINRVAAEPNNGDGHQVHNEHHERHHERHNAVREQLRFHETQIRFVETLFFVRFAAERAHHGNARENLTRHEVHAVDELLHDFELRHRHFHEEQHHHGNGEHGGHDDPAHREVRAGDHDNAADGQNGSVQNHAQHHDRHHLHLLHVIGAARDERGGREVLDFSVRERQHTLEQAASQAGADFCRRATRDEAHDYGDDHAERGEAEHFATRGEQVIHLHGVQVATELLVFGLGGGNRLLAHDGIGHVAHLRLRFIEHGLNVRFLHHAGVVSGFQLVKVHAGLVGVMHCNKRHGHGIVELRTMLAAEVGELVSAVGLLGVGIGK